MMQRGWAIGCTGLLGGLMVAFAGASAQLPQGIRPVPGDNSPKPSAATPLVIPAMPATAPTSLQPVGAPLPQAASVVSAVKRARLEYRNGLLTVIADNSSLNQILRDIARQTGMKITGGVNDERVFGTYGPAELGSVLGTLLDGTGSNLMLIQSADQAPLELVLTPRQGGATPPGPMSGQDAPNENVDLPPQLTQRRSNLPSAVPEPPVDPPQPQPFVPPVPAPVADAAPVAPSTGTTTEQSPNGVKTPQQIYEQLMQMQQQQKKTPQ